MSKINLMNKISKSNYKQVSFSTGANNSTFDDLFLENKIALPKKPNKRKKPKNTPKTIKKSEIQNVLNQPQAPKTKGLLEKTEAEIVKNFLLNTIAPEIGKSYLEAEKRENETYQHRANVIGPLDKENLKEGDMVLGVIKEFQKKGNKYAVLIGQQKGLKNDQEITQYAWTTIQNPSGTKNYNKGDRVVFVAKKDQNNKIVLKEYYPLIGELQVGDEINLRYASTQFVQINKNVGSNKKIKTNTISIKIGEHQAILNREDLPKWYYPGHSLKLKIKSIFQKGSKSYLEFEDVDLDQDPSADGFINYNQFKN